MSSPYDMLLQWCVMTFSTHNRYLCRVCVVKKEQADQSYVNTKQKHDTEEIEGGHVTKKFFMRLKIHDKTEAFSTVKLVVR